MPESRYKYLYERLGDHDFQLLVNALLTLRFENYVPLPLRQADGGRDGLAVTPPEGVEPAKSLVYQVKWSANGKEKDPVKWLDEVVTKEEESLRRLAAEGVRRYALVTNVPSTGSPGRGTFDRLGLKLDAHAKEFGLEQMVCHWRESVDGMVDSAPTEIKWQYADMLAGWDLIRYLISDEAAERNDHGLRTLLRKVASAQWGDDERVKFGQVDIDRERVADLFVDVNADRLHVTGRRRAERATPEPVGGAAAHLLERGARCVLVRGAPGQGKSTLTQFVSQVHRSAFLPTRQRPANFPTIDQPLFPLRLDLSDYAQWLTGVDVWAKDARKVNSTRPASQSTIECFLAELISHAAGGVSITAEVVQGIFERVPSIVVLDGLDEVGRSTTRAKVVDAIDQFCRRGEAYQTPPRVIVTTRPSSNELAEPSPDLFDTLVLKPFDSGQRDEYLQKWCSVRRVVGSEGRALRTSFAEKSREPYIGELAGNPMQLTILLDLLHKHGEATPTQRTELYESYVDLLLAREANKHPVSVRKHQKQLREIVPFLGWYLQAHSEEDPVNAQMSVRDLKAAIRHFQHTYGNPETMVDELFEATSDRLWALTSKNEGIYEFEVLSLREYFAARFLYRYAGEEVRDFDRNTVFRELLRRPYWLNTARFYGGNAEGGDVYVLADGIRDEVVEKSTPPSVVAAWTLLTDGVFTSRPRQVRDVLGSLCSDLNLSILLDAFDRGEITPLPNLPQLPAGDGPDPTWTRLTEHLAKHPADPGNPDRVRILRELLNQRADFAAWWADQTRAAAGTPSVTAWLRMTADCEGAAGIELHLDGLDVSRPFVAQSALNTGLVPPPGGGFEADLTRAVLDGLCPDVSSLRSQPAQIAVALSIDGFLTNSDNGFTEADGAAQRRRRDAVNRLRRAGSPFAAVAALRRFKTGEKSSTFPWSNAASALFDLAGPCWLASLIAIVGAASPFKLAYTRLAGTKPFGPEAHPATLLGEIRNNSGSASWWRDQLDSVNSLVERAGEQTTDGDLARGEWALALWCVAPPPVMSTLFGEWQAVIFRLSEARRHIVVDAARRIGSHGWLNPFTTVIEPVNDEIADLISVRHTRRQDPSADTSPHRTSIESPPSLLRVARANNWFKVDTAGSYR
ncbi:NACHT domain-containing protein [Saccharothrix variisporea]|uniref:NACHT domain-containing protein n=1 Tax=Saccharothrix variisporea TaxID=543527 RepID=A0A495XJP0_9PSEU|nr:large ATP-binding protein [Saccharothrix variisporea]RKT74317.1 hypothetical protein DFJ66_7661 [Saccharothrix variisporea]